MPGADRKLQQLDITSIETHGRLRTVKEAGVEAVAASLASIGLRTPISVRYYEERPEGMPGETVDALVLLTGAHRLEAARRLGWDRIECFVYFDGDEVDAQLWEIAENLHRSELTALEHDEQVALWVKLAAQKARQSDEPLRGGAQPNEKGQAKAARELGISEPAARRAVKVASLSDEAKEAARAAGLDDNRSALLEAAKHIAPEEQVKAIKERKAKRGAPASAVEPEPEFNPLSVRVFTPSASSPDYGGLTADQRIAELEENIRTLEGEFAEIMTEAKLYRDMKVQFEQGGYDKVVAGKDEEIRVLKERLFSESAGKAEWMRKSAFWEKQAKRLGWRDTRGEQPPADVPAEYDDAFFAATQAEG